MKAILRMALIILGGALATACTNNTYMEFDVEAGKY